MSQETMNKAIYAAQQAAQQRLLWCADALERACPGGVLHSVKVPGKPHVLVRLLWPGVLQELDTSTGEVLASTPAADMHDLRPEATALLMAKAQGRPVLRTECTTPLGVLLGTIDAAGVVRVHSKARELLAISEAGEPAKLRADFYVLKPEDLKPVLR